MLDGGLISFGATDAVRMANINKLCGLRHATPYQTTLYTTQNHIMLHRMVPVRVDCVELCSQYGDLGGCEGEGHCLQHQFLEPRQPHEATERVHLKKE